MLLKLCTSKKLHAPSGNPRNMRPTLTNIWFSLGDGMSTRRFQAQITIEFDSNVCFAQNYSIKHQRLKQKSNSLDTFDGQEKRM